jgi:hypothetical protein
MDSKVCPICKIRKPVDEFGKYFSKERQKYRVQNYCRVCEKIEKNKRAGEYYLRNQEKKKQYSRDYRADPKNKEKRKKLETHFKVKYRTELQDCYIADQLARKIGVSSKDIRSYPGLIETERARLQLIRALKKKRNEK